MQTERFAAEKGLWRAVALAVPFLAVLALLLAAGALEDSQRDQPVLLAVAVALSLVGGVLLAIGQSARLAELGALAVAIGFAVAIFLAVSGGSAETRPDISASFDERTETVTGTVSAANLPVDGRLAVRVDLQTVEEEKGVDDPTPYSPTGSLPLERATVGPDADGNAEHEFSVPVLTGSVYTHIVVEATSGDGEDRCIELDSLASPEGQTACAVIPVR